MSIFELGTVTVTSGSRVVVGNGTSWVTGGIAGGLLFVGADSAPIASIDGDGALTLAIDWPGRTRTAAYAISPITEQTKNTVGALERVNDLLSGLRVFSGLGRELAAAVTQEDVRRLLGVSAGQIGIGAAGPFSGRAAHNAKPEGFIYLATDQQLLYVRLAAANAWSGGLPFASGQNGREVQIGASASAIRWRYVGEPEAAWREVIPLSSIRGIDGYDGQEVELERAGDPAFIRWRLGNGPWVNLVAVSDLKGDEAESTQRAVEAEAASARSAADALAYRNTTNDHRVAVEAARFEVEVDRVAAEAAQSGAQTERQGAQTARVGAEGALAGAMEAEEASEAARDIARLYALQTEDLDVEGPGTRSALHYATKGARSALQASDAQVGAAQERRAAQQERADAENAADTATVKAAEATTEASRSKTEADRSTTQADRSEEQGDRSYNEAERALAAALRSEGADLSQRFSGSSLIVPAGGPILARPSSGTPNGNARSATELSGFRTTGGAATGAIVFKSPNNTINVMMRLLITGHTNNGHQYTTSVNALRQAVDGPYISTTKLALGTVDVPCRMGTDAAGKTCLIMGDVTTQWSWPHFRLSALFSNLDPATLETFAKGWTTEFVTDLSDYTNVTSFIANSLPGPVATALGAKADLSSPSLTGTPTAPTPAAGTNTQQIAPTNFVQTAVNNAITLLRDGVATGFDTLKKLYDRIEVHVANTSNPHSTTKSQVGLGNVDNTADANKPVSTAQQTALNGRVAKSGDTMTGQLTIADANARFTRGAQQRYVHLDGTWFGFLSNGGGWTLRVNDNGELWTAQIGDLNSRIEDRAYAHALSQANTRVNEIRTVSDFIVSPDSYETPTAGAVVLGCTWGGDRIVSRKAYIQIHRPDRGWSTMWRN